MERIVEFSPAFDHNEQGGGVHGVELRMVLKGVKGAVQFLLYTNWMLPHVQKATDQRMIEKGVKAIDLRCFYHPLPADLGYHSLTPRRDSQEAQECPYVATGQCYYDGSTLNAERIWQTLLIEGSDGVWSELERYYIETFEELA